MVIFVNMKRRLSNPKDKRTHKRFRFSFCITYSVEGHTGVYTSESGNIGMGGIRIYSEKQICPGLLLNMSLQSGKIKNPVHQLKARVVWSEIDTEREGRFLNCYSVGCQFIEITDEQLDFLKQFIRDITGINPDDPAAAL